MDASKGTQCSSSFSSSDNNNNNNNNNSEFVCTKFELNALKSETSPAEKHNSDDNSTEFVCTKVELNFLKSEKSPAEKHPNYNNNNIEFELNALKSDTFPAEKNNNDIKNEDSCIVGNEEKKILSAEQASSGSKRICQNENLTNLDDGKSGGVVNHCSICGKRFSSKRLIAKHMLEHNNDGNLGAILESVKSKTFPCSECPWAFSSFSGLQEHALKVHNQIKKSRVSSSKVVEKQYKCNICKISFNNRNERRLHSIVHSSNEENASGVSGSSESCKFCGKPVSQDTHMQFSGKDDVTQNFSACYDCVLLYTRTKKRSKGRFVSEEKQFLCELCGNRFHTLSNLERHNKVHTGEKPFACKLCGKSYAYMHALKQHYRMHTQEKPYNCEFCGKAFARRDYLKEHLRVHTKEKPYVCKICGRGFSQGGSLKLHQKVHTSQMDDFTPCTSSFDI